MARQLPSTGALNSMPSKRTERTREPGSSAPFYSLSYLETKAGESLRSGSSKPDWLTEREKSKKKKPHLKINGALRVCCSGGYDFKTIGAIGIPHRHTEQV